MKMEEELERLRRQLQQFYDWGEKYRQEGHLEKAAEYFKKAYKKSRELEEDATERTCAFNLGAVYVQLNNPSEGLRHLHKAVPPEGAIDARSNGDLYFNLGLAYEKSQMLEKALHHYNEAWKQYHFERDNLENEKESLDKVLKILIKFKRHEAAAEAYDKLAVVHEAEKNPTEQISVLCKKASQLRLSGKGEEASNILENCYQSLTDESSDTSIQTANVYNDLGLYLIQSQKYDLAINCFEKALPLARGSDTNLEVVIIQNLGAAYNFVGDYQRAMRFHREAIEKFAKLKNRNSQGQCFANLAFAHNQLGQLDEAGEAFLHALQAAKDTGDKHTQWQVYEGLGAVEFNRGNLKKAKTYFQLALQSLGSESQDIADRITGKLTHVIHSEINYGRGYGNTMVPISPSHTLHQTGEPVPLGTGAMEYQGSPVPMQTAHMMHANEGPRFLRVRKGTDTPLHHAKIARGLSSSLYMQQDSPRFRSLQGTAMKGRLEEAEESEKSSSSEEDSSGEDDAPGPSPKRTRERRFVSVRKADSFGPIHHPKIARGFSTPNPYSERMSLGYPYGGMSPLVQGTEYQSERTQQRSAVQQGPRSPALESPVVQEIFRPASSSPGRGSRQLQMRRDDDPKSNTLRKYERRLLEQEENEEAKGSESSSEEEDSSEDESESESEEESTAPKTPAKKSRPSNEPPTLPTESPPATKVPAVGTYEKPWGIQGLPVEKEDLSSEDDEEEEEGEEEEDESYDKVRYSKKASPGGEQGEGSGQYHTLKFTRSDGEEGEEDMANLPRGEREARLFQEHLKHQQREQPPDLPARDDGKKQSKTCIVM